MKFSFRYIFYGLLLFTVGNSLLSCDKVDVTFGNQNQQNDPNLSYFENYTVTLSTYQVDSFLTSGTNTFLVGFNNDPVFGTIHAGSYAEVEAPAINSLKDVTGITYDSLEILIKPNGIYYGDTLSNFNLNIYRVTSPIQKATVSDNNYYNTSSFTYGDLLGSKSIKVTPHNGNLLSIRLSDPLGQELFNKLQTGAVEITSQDFFRQYFKGLYFDVDSTTTNDLFGFNSADDSVIMRLHYEQRGLTTVAESIDFPFITAKQFNHIATNRTNTALESLIPNKKQLISSTLTDNKAYLNSSTGCYIKINMPDLLSLKELHPYVKAASAKLVIQPTPGTFSYPYQLPQSLNLYGTDINNNIVSSVTLGGELQTGNLSIDELYGINTAYTYDVTDFVNSILTTGQAAPSGLLLTTSATNLGDQSFSRLVINDASTSKGIQLKLYVLGL
ncbi:DUF4270 family protein [Ferruginibacter albus]|uniref:DUF4270 family protein n=1 Tax=Ferruginibacter albus TaxID=2875540 RepID=UPI001CC679D0|nr:DUF4270 family protein [Ferruginibacter albus]UAY53570.1 DUF4270 domain-containing protein [Ferruginibacter albus]